MSSTTNAARAAVWLKVGLSLRRPAGRPSTVREHCASTNVRQFRTTRRGTDTVRAMFRSVGA